MQALKGAIDFEDYVLGMLERLAGSLLESGLKAGIQGLFTAMTGGASGGGGFLTSLLGFFGFAKGGVVGTTRPQRFATGGVVGGPAGIDRVPAAIVGAHGAQPALLSKREGVLPAGLTDELRRVLRVPAPAASSAAASGSSAPNFTIVVQGGGGNWERTVQLDIIPALRRAYSSGAMDFLKK